MAKAPLLDVANMSEEEVATLDKELAAWKQAKTAAALLAIQEKEMRQDIVDKYFSTANSEGEHTILVGHGHRLVAGLKTNRTVDKEVLDACTQLPPENPMHLSVVKLQQYFNFSPSLILASYKDAPDTDLRVLSEIITEKKGLPSLTLEKVPSGKK